MIDACRHRNARHPMRQRHRALILIEPGEHFHENLLCEIFLLHAPREVRSHDFNDQRVEMVDQLARRRLVAVAHPLKAGWQVEGLVGVRHSMMEWNSYTSDKTRPTRGGYNLSYDKAVGLTRSGLKS